MQEENKVITPNDSGVSADNYAQLLADATKKMNERIAASEQEKAELAKKLTDQIVNGQPGEQPKEEPAKKEGFKELTEKMSKFDENTTNLEYWDTFTKARRAHMAEYGIDPCITHGLGPDGMPIEPANGEAEEVEGEMQIIEKAVKDAEGDPAKFTLSISPATKNWLYGK